MRVLLLLITGVCGDPLPNVHCRFLGTWQKGWGTYAEPYIPVRYNCSLMAEASYSFGGRARGLMVIGALGADVGEILGDNFGGQVTVRYRLAPL